MLFFAAWFEEDTPIITVRYPSLGFRRYCFLPDKKKADAHAPAFYSAEQLTGY